MTYQEVFVLFWEQVKESLEERQFVKLTMAKTIGKPNLRNIFIRPVYSENDIKVIVRLRFRSIETEDQEDELTIEEAYEIVKSHLRKSFFSVILFTTIKDFTFKINKKGAGSITEQLPSFKNI